MTFSRYGQVSLGSVPEKLAAFYESSFLAAGPMGGAAFSNDEAFLAWLREVHAFNVKSGMTAIAVGSIDERAISANYTLATVEWAAKFQRTGNTPIKFSISYLLRQSDEALKIAAYISHEDQEETMKSLGLI